MIGRIAVDPTNPQRVLVAAAGSIYSAGGKRGLYRTVDGGAHWKAILVPDLDAAPFTGVVDVAIDPVNPNRVYATQWDHHRTSYLRPYGGIGSGLYVTDNALATGAGAVTWERIDNSHVSGPLPSYDNTNYNPPRAPTGLDVSDTLGGWASRSPRATTRASTSSRASRSDRTRASSSPTTATARSRTAARPSWHGGRAGANPRFEWWFGRLFVDPVNKDHLFKMDVGLRKSSDGGATWSNVGGVHADQHGMAWDPNVPNRVYLGNDGGMYRSDANGDSGWIHGTDMPWLQEYHVAVSQQRPNRIAIGLQDNGSNRSWPNINDAVADPAAANWSSYGGGDGHYVVIDHTDDTYYYSCSQNAGCSGVHDRRSRRRRSRRRPPWARRTSSSRASPASSSATRSRSTRPGANPETVTMTSVGTSGAGGTGVTSTPALAFAHASGATVWKNGVAGTQSLGFGSRGSGLRCTTDAPLVAGSVGARRRCTSAATSSRARRTAGRTGRRSPPPTAHRAGAGRRRAEQQPAVRGSVPDDLDDRAVQVRPEHDLRGHRQRAALEDDRPRRDVAGVPEPVRTRPAAVDHVRDRRSAGLQPRLRVVRWLPRGLHVGERLRDDATARPGRT